MRTCATDGCDKKVRARGLCSTHYNRTLPNRHKKITVACARCGKETEKHHSSKYTLRFCSTTCRDKWRKETGTNPHPPVVAEYIRRYGESWIGLSETYCLTAMRKLDALTKAPRAAAEPLPPRPARFIGTNCGWCGTPFLFDAHITGSLALYCSNLCSKRRGRATRRARECQAPGTYTLAEVIRVWLKFGKHCAYCEQPMHELPDPDHVTPLSRGGSNSITNILPACRPCNGDKSDMTLSEWAADRRRRGLPPVTTAWHPADPRVTHLVPSEPTKPRWADSHISPDGLRVA